MTYRLSKPYGIWEFILGSNQASVQRCEEQGENGNHLNVGVGESKENVSYTMQYYAAIKKDDGP